MKYIKTYENLFKKILNKSKELLEPKSKMIDGEFNDKEKEELKKLGFEEHTRKTYTYISEIENINIYIDKYYVEDEIPGVADNYYKVKINNNGEDISFSSYDFSKILSKIEKYIPEEDSNIKKYNL
jgi:hypothetical protein